MLSAITGSLPWMSKITSTCGVMCIYDRAGTLYDIRSPLGISPAALRASKAAPQVMTGLRPVKEQGYSAYQSYRKTRVDLLKTQNKKRLKAVAVDFRRIWWDKGMRGGSKEGAGIWRPVPPQGYVSLGTSQHLYYTLCNHLLRTGCTAQSHSVSSYSNSSAAAYIT